MKISHVITTLDPGGAENALLDLCRGLQAQGLTQEIVYLKGQGSARPRFEELGLKVTHIPLPSLSSAMKTANSLRQKVAGSDIVHSHLLKANSVAALAQPACPLIGTRHNDEAILNRLPVRWIHQHLSRREARHVAISEAVKSFYVKRGLSADKFCVIPYGFEVPPLPEPSPQTRQHYGIPPQAPLLLHVGRLVEQKGQTFLLEALTQIPDTHLLICGTGPLEDTLRRKASQLNLQDRVHFAGFVDHVPQLMVDSDLFVLPSLWEGLGRVLLECMALGLPVVASHTSAIPQVLGNTGYLVTPGDSEALVAGIQTALQEQGNWEEKRQLMKERLASDFSMPVMIDAHLKLYREVLDE